jgi:methyl-accepting chemotaxis protein
MCLKTPILQKEKVVRTCTTKDEFFQLQGIDMLLDNNSSIEEMLSFMKAMTDSYNRLLAAFNTVNSHVMRQIGDQSTSLRTLEDKMDNNFTNLEIIAQKTTLNVEYLGSCVRELDTKTQTMSHTDRIMIRM